MIKNMFVKNDNILLFVTPFLLLIYGLLNYYFSFFVSDALCDFGCWGKISVADEWIRQVGGLLLVFVVGIALNYTLNKTNFISKNTYFPALFYVVGMSFFEEMYSLNGLVVAHLALVIMLFHLFSIYSLDDGRKLAFNASFLLGIAICFSPIHLVFFPFLCLMFGINRPIYWREILLCIIGCLLPILYAFTSAVFYHNTSFWEQTNIFYLNFDFRVERWEFLVLGILFLFMLVSLLNIRQHVRVSTIRFRKLVRMLLFFSFGLVFVGLYYLMGKDGEPNGFSSSLLAWSLLGAIRRTRTIYSIVLWVLFAFLFLASIVHFFL